MNTQYNEAMFNANMQTASLNAEAQVWVPRSAQDAAKDASGQVNCNQANMILNQAFLNHANENILKGMDDKPSPMSENQGNYMLSNGPMYNPGAEKGPIWQQISTPTMGTGQVSVETTKSQDVVMSNTDDAAPAAAPEVRTPQFGHTSHNSLDYGGDHMAALSGLTAARAHKVLNINPATAASVAAAAGVGTHQNLGSYIPGSPASSVGVMSNFSPLMLRTEPRNFAPRTNEFAKSTCPPPPVYRMENVSQYKPQHQQQQQQQQQQQSPYISPTDSSVSSTATEGDDPFVTTAPYGAQQTIVSPAPIHVPAAVPAFAPSTYYQQQQQQQPDYQVVSYQQHTVPYVNEWKLEGPPMQARAGMSPLLNELTNTPSGVPLSSTVFNSRFFPFVDSSCLATVPSNRHGVVRLRNIPFASKRSDIIALLGRSSRILNDTEEPVHIIMCRVTSKTMDAYVEFQTRDDAYRAVEKHESTAQRGRLSRLDNRPIEVEMSSQAQLMKDLFPVAAGINWEAPITVCENSGYQWGSFRGFISEEEMVMLGKHSEFPNRSPFARDCPQRPYECMISTIKKFPWWMSQHITVHQRHVMHRTLLDLIQYLQHAIQRRPSDQCLDRRLLKRLVDAGLRCPGFSVVQKDDIAWLAGKSEEEARLMYGQPRAASGWRHLYALVPKPGLPLDVVEWYVAVLRQRTVYENSLRPAGQRGIVDPLMGTTDAYFGYFWAEVCHPAGVHLDGMTLAQAASREMATIEGVLGRCFSQ